MELTASEREQIELILDDSPVVTEAVPLPEAVPVAEAAAAQEAPTVLTAAANNKGPATLRCDKNPIWKDGNGTLSARFDCRYSTINWGYKISPQVKSIITGKVNERGVSWWKNGKRMPKNAGHVVGKDYHFHGTLKPVKHDDVVQFQDYMTFRVKVAGKTGTGSITWASNVRARK